MKTENFMSVLTAALGTRKRGEGGEREGGCGVEVVVVSAVGGEW
jgi:hypothetical protein